MRKLILGALMTLAVMPASAVEDYTNRANFMLRYCKLAYTAKEALANVENAFFNGVCDGTVHATMLLAERTVCVPKSATLDQAMRVVVRYGELHPELTHEFFTEFVMIALHDAWPCKTPSNQRYRGPAAARCAALLRRKSLAHPQHGLCRPRRAGRRGGGVSPKLGGSRLCRWPQRDHRISLGRK